MVGPRALGLRLDSVSYRKVLDSGCEGAVDGNALVVGACTIN